MINITVDIQLPVEQLNQLLSADAARAACTNIYIGDTQPERDVNEEMFLFKRGNLI